MGVERRRDARYHVRLRVGVVRGKNVEWYFTENVSHRGLFIRMPRPPKQREIFDVRIVLPPDDKIIELHATACYLKMPSERANNPGAGVQFYGFGGVDAARWRQFVRDIKTKHPETLDPARALDLVPEVQSEAHKRLGPDAGTKVRLRLGSADDLYHLYQENIAKGFVLVPAEQEIALGTPMELRLVHPVTHAELTLAGVVKKNIARDRFRGVMIALAAMTPRRQEELLAFVNADIPISVEL